MALNNPEELQQLRHGDNPAVHLLTTLLYSVYCIQLRHGDNPAVHPLNTLLYSIYCIQLRHGDNPAVHLLTSYYIVV